jgi:type II secretory pathway component PulF
MSASATSFAYVAFDRGGKSVSGAVDAPDAASARDQLRARGLFVTQVIEARDGAAPSAPRGRGGGSRRAGRGRVLKHLMTLTRQLHVLIASGTPLVQALSALERQARDQAWRAVLADVRQKVEEGAALSEAMADYPHYFDDVCRSLISAGEASGRIEAMLERLAKLVRAEAHVRSSVTGAMVYPLLLIVISLCVLGILLTFVLPRFAGLFEQLGSPLPPTTQFVMAASDLLRGYWWAMLLGIGGCGFGLRAWIKTSRGRRAWHTALVRAPMLGKMMRSFSAARITRLLGIQLESKVPLLEALKLTRQAAGNLLFRDLIASAEDAATRGQPVSSAIAVGDLMDPAICEAIRSGEQTGQMATLLISVADFLDEENDVVVRSLTSIIEPLILIVLGVLVGFVALSMFLPLFDLTATTGGGGA